ncbi:MAG: ROK family protein [Eubacteriales bacterium]|nr:ROK family protein [Eubacteriales bacterium]
MFYGALEAGGTKMVCAIFNEQGEMLKRESIPTETPAITVPKLIAFFKSENIASLGVGCFGPLDLNEKSATFGYISTTPKLAWRNYPLVQAFEEGLNVPVKLDTDVNAAAFAEATLGAAKGLQSCMYVTIGTGIGGGMYINGQMTHGLVHPEVGHIAVKLHKDDPMPQGVCPSHGCCLEGLAAGPAMEKRWGKSAKELPDDHIAWEIEADYLAQMCCTAIYLVSPEKIILGGGVMQRKHIFTLIHKKVKEYLNGYIDSPAILEDIENYIVEPGLDVHSGITGCYLLAREAEK